MHLLSLSVISFLLSNSAPASESESLHNAAASPAPESPTSGEATTGKQGEEPDGLLEALLQNGSITRAQYDKFSAEQSDQGPSVSIGPKGFRATSADGESSIKVGGRVQVDGNLHDRSGVDDDLITDGTELRRARFEMKGTLPEGLLWAAEVDLGNNQTSIKDFWAGLECEEDMKLMIGHQKQPYSLDIEMSSNDIPFVERGVDTFLVSPFVDRAIGVRFDANNDSMFGAVGVYGESVSPNAVDDEGWGVSGRFVSAPIIEEDRVLHLGARGSVRKPEDDIRIRDESTNMSDFRVVDTGMIADVDTVAMYGVEAAFADGPFSIGGEYNSMDVSRSGGDYDFSSWHAQATYSLTGESRAKAYRIGSGEFKRLKADNESGRAWEVAARYATIDLNDGSLSGGEEEVVSLALNWYYTSNVRFMLNWSHILETDGGSAATGDAEGVSILTFRTQVNF